MVIIGGRLSSWVSDLADQSNQLPEKGSTSQPIGEQLSMHIVRIVTMIMLILMITMMMIMITII